jgi:hypothetical protein
VIYLQARPGERIEFVTAEEAARAEQADTEEAYGSFDRACYALVRFIGLIPWPLYVIAGWVALWLVFPADRLLLVAMPIGLCLLRVLYRLLAVVFFAGPMIALSLIGLAGIGSVPLAALTFGQAIGGVALLIMFAIFVNAAIEALLEEPLEKRRQRLARPSPPTPESRPTKARRSGLYFRDGANIVFPVRGGGR